MQTPLRRSTRGKGAQRLFGVVVALLLIPAIAIPVAFSSPAVEPAASPPKKQIAALKKQVGTLKRERNALRAQVRALQQETALIPQLAEIAAATGKYRDVANAVADGYVRDNANPCITGAGIHYIRGGWPNDSVLDPLQPEFLVYAPSGGNLKLVAVEYAVPARLSRPAFLGRSFETYSGGPGEPIWYLHVWLWQLNPAGTFAPLNRTVEC